MEIIKKFAALTEKFTRPVVALGMFDGVHLGHATVIRHALDIARDINGAGNFRDTRRARRLGRLFAWRL